MINIQGMTTPSSLYLVPTRPQNAKAPKKAIERPGRAKEKVPVAPVKLYSTPPVGMGFGKSVAMSLVVTALLFFMLPLTRYIAQLTEELSQYNSISVVNPPPPPLPEVQQPEEEVRDEELAPELEQPDPKPITLSELQASLHVGAGSSFAGGADLSEFFFQVQDIGEIIFEIKDLDKKPRLISAGHVTYPAELKRDRIEGEVVLLVMINEEGRVSVLKVERSTHRGFELSAIRAARAARYTSPTRNGEKVKVKFFLPFNFSLRNS